MRPFLTWVGVAALISTLGTAPAQAAPTPYAPVNRPGPALSVPTATLRAAVQCSKGVDRATRTPVLLVHGTTVTAEETWEWVYRPAFDATGTPYCIVHLPFRGTGDIQVAAEYVVQAIRDLHRRADRKIAIIGSSQGGMLPRWALRFWPDLRPMVDDLVGLVPSNHGTTASDFDDCAAKGCSPAAVQQGAHSKFIAALNSRQETFAGISYTNIYTHNDETVLPNKDDTGSSSLHGGGGRITNVAVQDICAGNPSEHLIVGSADFVAYNLARDALIHDGPASIARVKKAGCLQPIPPGVILVGGVLQVPSLVLGFGLGVGTAPDVRAEPRLRGYVFA